MDRLSDSAADLAARDRKLAEKPPAGPRCGCGDILRRWAAATVAAGRRLLRFLREGL